MQGSKWCDTIYLHVDPKIEPPTCFERHNTKNYHHHTPITKLGRMRMGRQMGGQVGKLGHF